jgi:hypothetical protein
MLLCRGNSFLHISFDNKIIQDDSKVPAHLYEQQVLKSHVPATARVCAGTFETHCISTLCSAMYCRLDLSTVF